MFTDKEFQSIIKSIFSKPFSRTTYEESNHCVSMEEIYPALPNIQQCKLNIYGNKQIQQTLTYTKYASIQPLKTIHLRDVFFSNYLIFDVDGNVFPDSFRFGPFSSSVGINYVLPITNNKLIFTREKRNRILNSKIQICNHGFFFDVAANPIFGHFLLETLSRLWKTPDYNNTQLLSSVTFPDYLKTILMKFNLNPKCLLESSGVVYLEILYIHTQASYICNTFHPIAKTVFSRLHKAKTEIQSENKTYLSRSRYSKRK